MFKQRLISGVILVILAFVILYFGGIVTFLATAGISLIGMFELLRVIHVEKSALAVIAYSGAILYYLLLILNLDQYIVPLVLLVLILLFTVYVFTFPKYEISHVAITFFSLFYVTVMLSCIYRIRMLEDGGCLIVLVFLSAWGNDTLAYCAGRLFGKHKMSPVLSPKKTVEGAVGGVAGAGLLGAIYGCLAVNFIAAQYNLMLVFAVVCAAGGLISIVGDLGASAIKRNYGIKDYSNLIPGHGGILDRFDSIIFTAPIIYYLLALVVGLK
ncbi:MAG: phosphatidate cytidylyltransferase [Eubacteriales bacterium]|nr:phosphatidate cytidylyltransferase [Eubacteriales bacterium]